MELPTDAAPAIKPQVRSMDIRSSRRPQPVESVRLKAPVVVSNSGKTMVGDVVAAQHPAAQAVHSRVKLSRGGVLDLRAAKIAPIDAETDAVADRHIKRHEVSHTPKPNTHRAAVIPAERLERAKTTPKSGSISRFTQKRAAPAAELPKTVAGPAEEAAIHTPVPPHVVTQHESLARILNSAPAEPIRSLQTSHAGRIAATVAAVSILAGYVWIQNYPKLAITSAGNQAGVTASLPGYLPSSYSLATTTTAPGIVTLQFASPNQTTPLTITQHRTSWDSSSLLDNYVSKVASDYSSVEGQGLTIYLFDSNNASWVNHGVWYSIAGTARISREQILKIAYSL